LKPRCAKPPKRRRDDRFIIGYRDPANRRDAAGDGRSAGRRRPARRGSHRQRATGARGGLAGKRGGALPAVGDDGKPDRHSRPDAAWRRSDLSRERGARGHFTAEQVRAAIRPDDPHFARTRLVCVENSHNFAGGCVWRVNDINPVVDAARTAGLALHLDGSRLLNAAIALGTSAADLARPFDTVTLCLSKGLGAPVGAVLAGSRELVGEARRWKHVFGGAMRQAGIVAAGGLYALDYNVDRLAEDHANAARLAAGLAEIPGVRLDPPPETNLVFFNVAETGLTGAEASARLLAGGVRSSRMGETRLRFVAHLDISSADIDRVIEIAQIALGSTP
jgi:threonine aldolase